MTILFSILANQLIRHQATSKVSCSFSDCWWPLNLLRGLSLYVWVNIPTLFPSPTQGTNTTKQYGGGHAVFSNHLGLWTWTYWLPWTIREQSFLIAGIHPLLSKWMRIVCPRPFSKGYLLWHLGNFALNFEQLLTSLNDSESCSTLLRFFLSVMCQTLHQTLLKSILNSLMLIIGVSIRILHTEVCLV